MGFLTIFLKTTQEVFGTKILFCKHSFLNQFMKIIMKKRSEQCHYFTYIQRYIYAMLLTEIFKLISVRVHKK